MSPRILSKVPADAWQTIWERYRNGESSGELAKSYGVSAPSICNGLVRRGYNLRSAQETFLRGRKPLTKSEQDARHYRKHGEKTRVRMRAKYREKPALFREKSKTRSPKPPPKGIVSKKCRTCGQEKNFGEFSRHRCAKYGHRLDCKECAAKEMRSRYLANPQRAKEQARRWRQHNPDKYRASKRATEKKLLKNPIYKLRSVLRKQLVEILKRKGVRKCESVLVLVGCSLAEFKTHIESHFKDGMTWKNYGLYTKKEPWKWNIDHVLPVDKFDLSLKSEREHCFHFSNLRPLWGRDNILKSNKVASTNQRAVRDLNSADPVAKE